MSALRAFPPLTSSASLVFRFSAPPRACQHVLRTFSSSQSTQSASKRKMQTSTAYTPYSSLDTQPPPPRNIGIPETSITSTIPQLNDTRPPQPLIQYDIESGELAKGVENISLTEQEAQKSKAASSTPPTQAQTRPKRTLRALTATIKLSSRAVNQLRALYDQPEPKLIKVGVKNKGCSGLAYHLEYVETPSKLDEVVEQDGVKVIIDAKALFSIIGSEMDWVEDKLNQRFVFNNPNIKETCGCGESFMV